MTLRITMYMYSGRPDPQWEITDAEEAELRRLIDSPAFDTARPIIPWRLGYRGFGVIDSAAPDQPLLRVRERSLPDFSFYGVPEVEQFLLNSAPADDPRLPIPMRAVSFKRDVRFRVPPPDIDRPPPIIQPRAVTQSKAVDALPWNPIDPKWSGANQGITNCYAYASNRNMGRFLAPGDESNNESTGTGASMLSGVLSDGMVQTTGPDQQLTAGQGLHICLVCWPFADHHWYRQDADGWWSHKVGGSPITRLDYSNQPIADPRLCNRGPYTIFVSWLRSPQAVWA